MTRRRAIVALAIWAALVISLELSDSRPDALVLAGVVGVSTAVLFVVVDLASTVERARWSRVRRSWRDVRRTDPRARSLRRRLRATWWSGSTEIADTLVQLVDDRLEAHHHVARRTDPLAAAAVLTPRLRQLVDGPRRQIASVGELEQILTDIEAL